MTDDRPREPDLKVRCRRIGLPLPVSEHVACPYCFGTEADVQTGRYVRFCDYREGVDPICFGYPGRLPG